VRQYLVIQDTATHSVLGDAAAAPMNEGLTTSFRGRLLCGERRRVPADCSGVVLRADEQETDKAQSWSVAAGFDDLFLWQRERPIVAADKFNVWWQWPALARAVHRPLTEAEIESAAARVAAREFRSARSAQSTPSKRKRPLGAVESSAADASTASTATTSAAAAAAAVVASPRRSPARAAKLQSPFAAADSATPSKRKLIDAADGKLQTPDTETKAPRMTTPKSSPRRSLPVEKRRRLVRKADSSDADADASADDQ